jgi:hypothetical protein
LHGFLGLTRYYCKFVKNYGKIPAPLTALLKNNSFTWTPVAAQAFQTLNMAMCTTLVLALPYFTKTFVLECDALGKGIGVVLMQEGRPLAFTSKQLSERNLGKSIYEKKILAILHVVDLWHPYLLHMILVTLVMSLQLMYSGSHKDFLPEKSDCYLLPKTHF